jgi:hypothetical protein
LLALVAVPHASAATWTLARARHVLATQTVVGWDVAQADRPLFMVTVERSDVGALRPVGRGRFAYRGPAHDVARDGTVAVSFTIRPQTTTTFVVLSFRGPPPDTSQPASPLRAAFTYAWFPEAWDQQHTDPFTRYRPTAGFYDSSDRDRIRREIAAMRYGKIDAGIYSWWGRGTSTDARFQRYLDAARQTPFRWALYDESEGYGDPSPDAIRRDLEWIRDVYASQPSYLKLNGRFVVFVYGGVESCSVAERWHDANAGTGAYLVLPAFDGFRNCANQPDSWHFYSATIPEFELHGYSYGVCPGFFRIDESEPREVRDLEQWKQSIRDMVASNEPLQLVVTFNEWGEGTSVESADEWQSPSGYGAYLDALHDDGA